MKRLIIGDGLLGSCLHKKTGWDYISRKKDNIDFCDIESYKELLQNYDEIINCVAYTNTYSPEKDKHWSVNYKAVADLTDFCNSHNKKIIHISTDYVYSNSKSDASENDVPVHCENWYGLTKLLADGYIELKSKSFLIIRASHKKNPFVYEYAYTNQIGNFDYVDEIAPLIIDLVVKGASGIYNVGTEKKTMFEMAKKTKEDVKPTTDMYNKTMPQDISMNIDKLKKFISMEVNENKGVNLLTKEELILFEDGICELFNAGKIKAPIHLYYGNEDKMIQIFNHVKKDDWVFCTWRSHYQCLLKGVDKEVVKRDILRGKSIALCYPSHNIYSSAIVTGIIPISVGVALDIKNKGLSNHVWCFVGDMTAETGTFYENYKYAVNFDLPITFIIENNGKSVCTDTSKTWGQKSHSYSNGFMEKIIYYEYETKYPHAGSGVRIQF